MSLFSDFDINKTVHDYDYTRKAVINLSRLTSPDRLQKLDRQAITDYLTSQMELVSFRDYLCRYIYLAAGMTVPYPEVSQETYESIIREAFRERGVPFSLEKTTRKPSQAIRSWLNQSSVHRETVFLLGFGLGMSVSDVSTFLMKVIKDQDFNLALPFERACYECLQQQLPWSQVSVRAASYEASSAGTSPMTEEWNRLLSGAKESLRAWDALSAEAVDPSDHSVRDAAIERSLYCALPRDANGNITTAGRVLRRYLAPIRLSRQRISLLNRGTVPLSRYDILSLTFLICAAPQDIEPSERLDRFIRMSNESLARCHMLEVYPVNPFETVLLLCMLTEDPLDAYSELWEQQ